MRRQVRRETELNDEIAVRKESKRTLYQSREALRLFAAHQEQVREAERKRSLERELDGRIFCDLKKEMLFQ